jgi:hypothetical protein
VKVLLALSVLAAVLPSSPAALPLSPSPQPAVTRPAPVPRDAVRVMLSSDPTVEGYTVTFSSYVAGFTVDATKLHVDRAALDGTVQARDVATLAGPPQSQTGPPGPAQTVRVPLTVPRSALLQGMQTLVLRTDAGAALRDGSPVTLGAYPISSSVHVDVPDPGGDAALRRRFVGVPLYGYGPLALTCAVDRIPYAVVITRPQTPLRIVRIDRTQGAMLLHTSYDTSDYSFAFKALDPLRVVFDTSVRPSIGGASFSYPGAARPVVSTPVPGAPMTPAPPLTREDVTRQHEITTSVMHQISTTGCRSLHIAAADAWHLERMATTVVPAPQLTRVRLGLTHEQVAQIEGFPSAYATKAELMRMPEWRYDRPAPFSSAVTFDGDRVVKFQPPGNLP